MNLKDFFVKEAGRILKQAEKAGMEIVEHGYGSQIIIYTGLAYDAEGKLTTYTNEEEQ